MITAVLSLALGIGATTIFSVIYTVLLDPYPYKHADRMVHLQMRQESDRLPRPSENLTGDQILVTANVGRFSLNLFDYMGVTPVIGREFTPGDAPTAFPPRRCRQLFILTMPTADPRDCWMSFVKLKPGAKSPIAQSQFQTLIDRYAKEDSSYSQERKAYIVTLNEEVL